MSIFFSCNSFLCCSFEEEKANQKPAIDMAPNISRKLELFHLQLMHAISLFSTLFLMVGLVDLGKMCKLIGLNLYEL